MPVVESARAQSAATARGASGIPTASVRKGSVVRTVSSIGELKASRSALLSAPFEGKIVKLVPEGTRVAPEDPVIWMDTEELDQKMIDTEASLRLAKKDHEAAEEAYRLQEIQNQYNLEAEQARVELAEQRLRDSEMKYDTEKILVDRKISATSRLDDAQLVKLQSAVELRNARINLKKTEENLASNLRVRQTQIDKAKLEIDRIEKVLTDTQQRIDSAVLRAPVAGEVTYQRSFRQGQSTKVAEGDSVFPRQNLVEIPDRSEMVALVPVSELEIASVEIGQSAEVLLDALPGQRFKGTVDRKSIVPIDTSSGRGGSTTTTGPREFEVRIRMADSNPLFFQGMTATARIEVGRADDALIVPIEAMAARDGKLGVYTGPGSFKAAKVLLINDLVAAIEGDVSEGETVYLRDPAGTLDEARVTGRAALAMVRKQLEADAEAKRAAAPPPPALQPQEGERPRRRRPAGEQAAPTGGGGE